MLLICNWKLEPLLVHLLMEEKRMNMQSSTRGINLLMINSIVFLQGMIILHALMEERFVVHIVVNLTIMFRDARWERKQTGSRWRKHYLKKRCIRFALFVKRGDMLSLIVGLYIQLVVPHIYNKRTKRWAKVKPQMPLLMWKEKFHMRKNCSSKNRHGSGLVRSGRTSWHSKTYSFCTYTNFGCMHVFLCCCKILPWS